MNLRRYWPTMVAVAYCGLAAVLILPGEHAGPMNIYVGLLFAFPFDIVLNTIPNHYALRLLSIGYQSKELSLGHEEIPSARGWFIVSLLIVGVVFLVNHFVVKWWRSRLHQKPIFKPMFDLIIIGGGPGVCVELRA